MLNKYRLLVRETRIFRVATIVVLLGFLPLVSGSIYYLGKSVMLNSDAVGIQNLTPWESYSAPENVLKAQNKVDELQEQFNKRIRLEELRAKRDGSQQKPTISSGNGQLTPQQELAQLRAKKELAQLRAEKRLAELRAKRDGGQTNDRRQLARQELARRELARRNPFDQFDDSEQLSKNSALPEGYVLDTNLDAESGELAKELAVLELDRRSKVKSWRYRKKRKEALSTAGMLFGSAVAWMALVLLLFSSIYWVMLPKAKS